MEDALAQYQDTKKEREREMAFLNKKVHIVYLFDFVYLCAPDICIHNFRLFSPSLIFLRLPSQFPQAKKMVRYQSTNESTQMDVEGRKEALRRTGEEEKEVKGEAMEEGDGRNEV